MSDLQTGDTVYWEDPDNGFSSGYYLINHILMEPEYGASDDDILTLTRGGSLCEVLRSEIS